MSRAAALGVLLVAACGGRPPAARLAAAPAAAERRAWLGWRPEPGSSFRACGHRDSEPIRGLGQANCWRGDSYGPRLSSDDGFVRDDSPRDRGPGGRCRLVYEDGRAGVPVRVWLVRAAERVLVEAWDLGPGATAEPAFLEVSFSPDGQWMGIARLRGPRGAADVEAVRVVPARPCP